MREGWLNLPWWWRFPKTGPPNYPFYIILIGFSSVNHTAIFYAIGLSPLWKLPKKLFWKPEALPQRHRSYDLRMIGRTHGHLQHDQLDGVVEDQLHGGMRFPLQHGQHHHRKRVTSWLWQRKKEINPQFLISRWFLIRGMCCSATP